MIVHARAPLRLGFAGGGTDISPYCDEYGGQVLNAAISRYAYAVITSSKDGKIHFVSTDDDVEETYSKEDEIPLGEGALKTIKGTYLRIIRDFNSGKPLLIKITAFCDAPIGSGLGASSALVVAMVRAFQEYLKLPLDDYKVADLAYQIERKDCGFAGGFQDQYAATFGGFNFMEFNGQNRTLVHPLRIRNWVVAELEASIILYYTGFRRNSSNIVNDQAEILRKKPEKTLSALHGLKKESQRMRDLLLRNNLIGIVETLRNAWELKKQMSDAICTPKIQEIYDVAVDAGALAGKVSGAGGGGFMMFYVSAEKYVKVIRALQGYSNEGQVSNCHFVNIGSHSWIPNL